MNTLVNRVSQYLSDVYRIRGAFFQLLRQQLILRYRRTILGYFWTLVNPLLMMSIMTVVFAALFKADLRTFPIFLLSGMIPWNLFNAVLSQSGSTFINNEGLIKKIYLPKIIFPLSLASALLVDSLLSFVAFFAILLIIGGHLSWSIFFIPIAFMLLFLFAVGISLITSVITVFFRDLQYVIPVLLQGLFFLTPIFYKHEALSGKVSELIGLNPLLPYITLFRAPLSEAAMPTTLVIFKAVLLAFASLFIGLFIFFSQEKKIIFRL